MMYEQKELRIDLGCGSVKKEGTLGIDKDSVAGVDFAVDIGNEPLPFSDRSVAYVHSSHFLEHLADPSPVFLEISRVCQDNARLEFWTPYAWSNSAFIPGHKFFFAEDVYLHTSVLFTDFWEDILQGRWVLNEIQFNVDPKMLLYLSNKQISLDFALRHLHNVAREFCVHITVLHTKPYPSPSLPRRTFSTSRNTPRYEIKPDKAAPSALADETLMSKKVDEAIKAFAQGGALPPWE